jgi:superoxide dismutase
MRARAAAKKSFGMATELHTVPRPCDALEPTIDERAMRTHHGKRDAA